MLQTSSQDYFFPLDPMDIYVYESRKIVHVELRFRYHWHNEIETPFWTYEEKRAFHDRFDKLVWSIWGNRFWLKCRGSSPFGQRNRNKKWDVNFDIKWVHHNEHWNIHVTKHSGNVPPAGTAFPTRNMYLT